MTNHKNIPALRFKEFVGEWENKKLEQLFNFKNGVNASKEQYGKGVKFINVLDIINNDFIMYDNIQGLVDISDDIFKKNEVKYGDILFQRSSETREEVGQANVYLDKTKSATFGGFVIRGQKIADYNPRFMNYLLRTSAARKEIVTKSGGSTRFNVGQDILSKVKVTLPQIPEQQKIANFLTAIDKKIQQLRAKHRLLEAYKKGIMQQIFKQDIRFKNDDGEVFGDWEVKRLKDILTYEQPTKYIVSNTEYDNSYETPVLTAGKTFILGYTNETKSIFKHHPVIIFDDFTTAYKYVDFDFKVKSSAMKILKPIDDKINLKYIFEAMGTIRFPLGEHKRYWISEYSYMKIPFPCEAEQQKIANFLSSIDEKIGQVREQVEAMEGFKKGLLQRMFV